MIQSLAVFAAIVPVLLLAETIESNLAIENAASHNEFPFAASIQMKNSSSHSYDHQCLGSIINELHVLTAAHCFFNTEDPGQLTVVVGDDILNTTTMTNRFKVERIIKHKYYQPYEGFDIAVVKLTSRMPLDKKTVVKVKLNGKENIASGQKMYAIGRNPKRLVDSDPPLVSIPHRAIDNRTCRKNKFTYLTKQEVCAIAFKSFGPCAGDSGSPLMNPDKHIQWGLLSYSRSPCKPNRIYVFTRIQPFIEWIHQTIDST